MTKYQTIQVSSRYYYDVRLQNVVITNRVGEKDPDIQNKILLETESLTKNKEQKGEHRGGKQIYILVRNMKDFLIYQR